MIRTTVATFTLLSIFTCTAIAQSPNCKEIKDSLERLRCYDAQPNPAPAAPAAAPSAATAPAVAKPAVPAEDPFIAKAKARVKQQLLDPTSARFQDIKIKTVNGKKGLCGLVNAKNSTGGMTGTLSFTYDGEYATIMMFNAGPGNPTSFGADILSATLGTRLAAHDLYCK
jgi:hypothetical protein